MRKSLFIFNDGRYNPFKSIDKYKSFDVKDNKIIGKRPCARDCFTMLFFGENKLILVGGDKHQIS
jgi:hypothetical protein